MVSEKKTTLKACGDWIILIPMPWEHPKGWFFPIYKYINYAIGEVLTSKQRDFGPGDKIFYRIFDAQEFTLRDVKLHAIKVQSVIGIHIEQ